MKYIVYFFVFVQFVSCKNNGLHDDALVSNSEKCLDIKSLDVFASGPIYEIIGSAHVDTTLIHNLHKELDMLEMEEGGDLRGSKPFIPIIIKHIEAIRQNMIEKEELRWMELFASYINRIYPEKSPRIKLTQENICKNWQILNSFYNTLFDSREVANMIPTFNFGPFYIDDFKDGMIEERLPIKESINIDGFTFRNHGLYISFYEDKEDVIPYFLINKAKWDIQNISIHKDLQKLEDFGYYLNIHIDSEKFVVYFNQNRTPVFYFQSW